jgi:hypothetical protein
MDVKERREESCLRWWGKRMIRTSGTFMKGSAGKRVWKRKGENMVLKRTVG